MIPHRVYLCVTNAPRQRRGVSEWIRLLFLQPTRQLPLTFAGLLGAKAACTLQAADSQMEHGINCSKLGCQIILVEENETEEPYFLESLSYMLTSNAKTLRTAERNGHRCCDVCRRRQTKQASILDHPRRATISLRLSCID